MNTPLPTKPLVQRLRDLKEGGFDLDFDALPPEVRQQCIEAEDLAGEAQIEIERLSKRVEAQVQELETAGAANADLAREMERQRWLLKQILNDLPAKRDWLNPDVEREARELLA